VPAPVPAGNRPVVVAQGRPLLEAAAWVGRACWAELRLHEVLTDWLATEVDPERRTALWAVRSHRAGVAQAWHRRLPELRELPRADFVRPGDAQVEAWFTNLAAIEAGDAHARPAALAATLHALADGYEAHRAVAVGPADAPVADTLALAVARSVADGAALPVPISDPASAPTAELRPPALP
jgi:hypothetical protein